MNGMSIGRVWPLASPAQPLQVIKVSDHFTDQTYRYMITRQAHLFLAEKPIEVELFPFVVDKDLKIELLKRHIVIRKRSINDPWIIREIKITTKFIMDQLACLKKQCHILMLKIIG